MHVCIQTCVTLICSVTRVYTYLQCYTSLYLLLILETLAKLQLTLLVEISLVSHVHLAFILIYLYSFYTKSRVYLR